MQNIRMNIKIKKIRSLSVKNVIMSMTRRLGIHGKTMIRFRNVWNVMIRRRLIQKIKTRRSYNWPFTTTARNATRLS